MRVFELPSHTGLTHVLDKGLGPRGWEDVLEVAGEHISIVKLGWGTAAVTGRLERKLKVLRQADKPVVIGGTFFEAVYAKNALDAYKAWLDSLGLTHVKISDGTIDIPRERKLELIAEFARDFTVLSEVGSKDSSVEYTADQWTQWLREELDAGAWKVITEAREGGTAGIFDSSGGMRTELIGEIASAVGSRTSCSRRRRRVRRHGSSSSSARRSTSATSRRRSDPAQDAPARAARRHAEGGASWFRLTSSSGTRSA